MATALTLLGAVLAPAVTIYAANKINKQGDTNNRVLEKMTGTGLAVAFAGWAVSSFAGTGGRNSGAYDFGTGVLLGGGVTAGLSLGARMTTTEAGGKAPANIAGGRPVFSPIAGLPPARVGMPAYYQAAPRYR